MSLVRKVASWMLFLPQPSLSIMEYILMTPFWGQVDSPTLSWNTINYQQNEHLIELSCYLVRAARNIDEKQNFSREAFLGTGNGFMAQ